MNLLESSFATALRPDEVDSEAEMDEGILFNLTQTRQNLIFPLVDDDDIPLPPGLPPGTEEVTSDDDIPMPEDPPPGEEDICNHLKSVLIQDI